MKVTNAMKEARGMKAMKQVKGKEDKNKKRKKEKKLLREACDVSGSTTRVRNKHYLC